MIEITEKINEGISPNHSINNKNNLSEAQNDLKDPSGSAPTAFQKFAAAGAGFATPSGLEKPLPRKKKLGRPRKHPKKKSLNVDESRAFAEQTFAGAVGSDIEPTEKPKEPICFAEFTGPFLGMMSHIPAAKLGDKRWALTKDESQELAKALDPLINLLLPELEKMDPKSAALLSFGMVAASIYHRKALEIETIRAPAAQPVSTVPVENQPKANAGAPT